MRRGLARIWLREEYEACQEMAKTKAETNSARLLRD